MRFFDKRTKFGRVIAFDVVIDIRYRPASIAAVNSDLGGVDFTSLRPPTNNRFFLFQEYFTRLINHKHFFLLQGSILQPQVHAPIT